MTIQRADLESKLREIQSVLDETKDNARDTVVLVAVAVVVIVALAFLVGRRKGAKKGKARIEIYEVS